MKKVIVDPMLDPDELTYSAMNIPITDASCAIKIMYIPNPLVENQYAKDVRSESFSTLLNCAPNVLA